jgi:hypothetical protein
MSLPGPGVLLVTIASNSTSKNQRSRRASMPSSVSPARSGNLAPFRPAAAAAAANASGVAFSTNLRAVRLLYAPVLIQNSFVYRRISASVAGSTPSGCVRISSSTSRISRFDA